jgi:hypothetical protein
VTYALEDIKAITRPTIHISLTPVSQPAKTHSNLDVRPTSQTRKSCTRASRNPISLTKMPHSRTSLTYPIPYQIPAHKHDQHSCIRRTRYKNLLPLRTRQPPYRHCEKYRKSRNHSQLRLRLLHNIQTRDRADEQHGSKERGNDVNCALDVLIEEVLRRVVNVWIGFSAPGPVVA